MTIGHSEIRLEWASRGTSEYYDITQLVNQITWSGSVSEAYRTLSVSLTNTVNGERRRINFQVGDKIRFYNNERELFQGRLFSRDVDHEGNESATIYDTNVYLTKSTTTATYRNITAAALIKRLATAYGLSLGQIDDTGYVIPKLSPESKTLYDIMLMALSITRDQTGKRFFLYSQNGRLFLTERKERVNRLMLESGLNILTASYSQSIEDMRTRVIVVGGDKEKGEWRATEQNAELIARYGYMQHEERLSGDKITASAVRQAAKQKLAELATIDDEAKVSAIGLDTCIAGSAIYAREPMTQIIGGYYVTADSHTFDADGGHTMDITLSATDDLPRVDYIQEVREEDDDD